MSDLKLPLIIVAVGAALSLADFTPADDPVVAVTQVDEDRVQSLRDLLTKQHEVVLAKLEDHTNRLEALQVITEQPPEVPQIP